MDEFKRRERAFEAHFALEEEIKFIINSKACHIFGHWLAHEKLNLDGVAAAELEQLLATENLKHGKIELILDLATNTLQANQIETHDCELKNQFKLAQRQAKMEFSNTLH